MKKIFCLLTLAILITGVFAACGSNGSKEAVATEGSAQQGYVYRCGTKVPGYGYNHSTTHSQAD